MWSSRSEIHHAVYFSPGAGLVHRSVTSSSTAIDDSSCRARGFSAVSNIYSLAGDGAPSRDCSHRTISMSAPMVLSVGRSPVTSSMSMMPVLYMSVFLAAFNL